MGSRCWPSVSLRVIAGVLLRQYCSAALGSTGHTLQSGKKLVAGNNLTLLERGSRGGKTAKSMLKEPGAFPA